MKKFIGIAMAIMVMMGSVMAPASAAATIIQPTEAYVVSVTCSAPSARSVRTYTTVIRFEDGTTKTIRKVGKCVAEAGDTVIWYGGTNIELSTGD